jgi:hypothetical protein
MARPFPARGSAFAGSRTRVEDEARRLIEARGKMTFFLNGCVVARAADGTSTKPRGHTCGTWWPLEYHGDAYASALSDHLDLLAMEHSGPRVVADLGEVQEYVSACALGGVPDVRLLFCASPIRTVDPVPEWLTRAVAASTRLGVDVAYLSGTYSFLEEAGQVGVPELAEYVARRLNPAGLFDYEEDALGFIELYRTFESRHGLELLDDDAAPIELWEDVRLSASARGIARATCQRR